MLEFYPQIKQFHIVCVILSGLLFAVRALAAIAGARWPMTAPMRYLSYAIDSVLLTSALMLLTILPSAIFANGWLLAKLTVLACYIVLGSFALKRARTTTARTLCLVSAAAAYLFVVSIALVHHPLGFLRHCLNGSRVMSINSPRPLGVASYFIARPGQAGLIKASDADLIRWA